MDQGFTSADDMSNISQNIQKLPNFGISWPYLESPLEMHSNKYKQAWYWFINSWNRGDVTISEIWEKQTHYKCC